MKKLLLFITITILLVSCVSACIPKTTIILDQDRNNCLGATDFRNIINESTLKYKEGYLSYFCENNVRKIEFKQKDFEFFKQYISWRNIIKQTDEEYKVYKKEVRKINLNPFNCKKINIKREGSWTVYKNEIKFYCKFFKPKAKELRDCLFIK